MTAKSFHLSDVLSVSTDALVSFDHMDGIYRVMGHLSGDPHITTTDLIGYADQARAEILKQHPSLENIQVPDWDNLGIGWHYISSQKRLEIIKKWVESLYPIYGEFISLESVIEVDRKSDLEIIAEAKGINPKEALDRTVVVAVDSSTTNQ